MRARVAFYGPVVELVLVQLYGWAATHMAKHRRPPAGCPLLATHMANCLSWLAPPRRLAPRSWCTGIPCMARSARHGDPLTLFKDPFTADPNELFLYMYSDVAASCPGPSHNPPTKGSRGVLPAIVIRMRQAALFVPGVMHCIIPCPLTTTATFSRPKYFVHLLLCPMQPTFASSARWSWATRRTGC